MPPDGRRTLRARKVSQAMAVVDDASRVQATQARLDALENDNDAGDALAADSDDEEVVLESDDDDGDGGSNKKGKKGKKVGSKRKTRGAGAAGRGVMSFTRLLENSIMDQGQSGPSYLSAAAGPPKLSAPRKFCSVCGNASQYTCSRCRSRYCCRKCYTVHTETRCLKFTL